ncbi:unnamed protein product [Vitrella brassicaformis CCMP3155]|uniref:Peptidase C1A papain C-terminal domain-containing protein n=1 Tax=Vitrella brassicaformis (strain CCMP3155) TaxID=1169540 RepID=A0A0G4GS09_VITBC|nr:unnamed protein product [Vitrella brassicaformis CCMP3155]|mmetsp:Transcript_4504/g.10436  ORF Transcript_4504/g.10436 Transcript_4504/m.10436 type:complete len:692 (-) Transcript_4504:95-2170(-)|eukprot:CEM33149.1 unnamed protein product [Vitrella brassicaformis CCMP3155]
MALPSLAIFLVFFISASATSTPCPSKATALTLAESFWRWQWVALGCEGGFEGDVLEVILTPAEHGLCEVILVRPKGDLRILYDQSKTTFDEKMAGQMRREGNWVGLDAHLCSETSFIGMQPLTRPIRKEQITFAFEQIQRLRAQEIKGGRKCGGDLALHSDLGVTHAEEEMVALGVEKKFTIYVKEGPVNTDTTETKVVDTATARRRLGWFGSSSSSDGGAAIPVTVRLIMYEQWHGSDNNITRSYRFVSSNPSPCRISAATAKNMQKNIMMMDDLRDTVSRQNQRAGEWQARINEVALDHVHGGPDAWRRKYLGDRTKEAVLPYLDKERLKQKSERMADATLKRLGLYEFPLSYDVRKAHPTCVLPPRSQDSCGSCWAFAAVGAWEKQVCKLGDGHARDLSRQRIINCGESSFGCDGGHAYTAYNAILRDGVVPESCAPYTSGKSGAPVGEPLGTGLCKHKSTYSGCDMYFGRPPNTIEADKGQFIRDGEVSGVPNSPSTSFLMGEAAIQGAIMTYGAVWAGFTVFGDFQSYSHGVYKRRSNQELGGHAVQLIGWGQTDNGQKYWIAENSWGDTWGENQHMQQCSQQECRGDFCDQSMAASASKQHGETCGYFRITRGENHVGIEELAAHSFVQGLEPDSTHVPQSSEQFAEGAAIGAGVAGGGLLVVAGIAAAVWKLFCSGGRGGYDKM